MFYPDPWIGTEEAEMAFLLAAPGERVELKVYTTSYRRICEKTLKGVEEGNYERVKFDESWCKGLANGTYLFVVEVYGGSALRGRKIGKFVVLK